jgi:hypothetical protein
MPAFVSQGLDQVETQAPDVKSTEYPRVFDEDGFSIDIVPSTKYYQSYDRDGHALIYSATEWECEYWSRRYLKARQEGSWEDEARTLNSGIVAGKL